MEKMAAFLLFVAVTASVVLADCEYPKHTSSHPAQERLGPFKGLSWAAKDDWGEYEYSVTICGSLASNFGPEFADAGVVQTKISTEHRVIVGSTKSTSLMAGAEWIQIEYSKGKEYGSHCNNEPRRAHIMITCDQYETQGKLRVIEENKNKTGECYYLFELAHAGMCQPVTSGLGAGSVFCIVFIAVVGVYLIGGFIYQRLVVGAKGWEQLPNYAFWQDFGNLQADGCDFVCRTRSKAGSREYRGIGDDQLQDEDTGRDDSLLPM